MAARICGRGSLTLAVQETVRKAKARPRMTSHGLYSVSQAHLEVPPASGSTTVWGVSMKTQAPRDSSDSNYNKYASPIVPRHDFPPAHEWALTGKSGYCNALIKMSVLTTRSHVMTEA